MAAIAPLKKIMLSRSPKSVATAQANIEVLAQHIEILYKKIKTLTNLVSTIGDQLDEKTAVDDAHFEMDEGTDEVAEDVEEPPASQRIKAE